MSKIYKTVRLAYSAKVWIDHLIVCRERELKEEIKNGLLDKLETDIQNNYSEILDGISINVILKVSAGSVIEQAYRFCKTRNFTDDEWEEIQTRMDKTVVKENFQNENTVTPRIFLERNVLEGLEELRYKFKRNEPGKRLPKLSYIIKLVVFAFYSQLED
ncbi:hypothetical protein SN4111_00840 [Ligilactobacillus agilis]|uniref:hypothetical protein n=1 Tax=Ligilactobacillus agilis TaxID=1601 RepID=UPI001437D606|nr:hypothetical protein [Ligilactobacillus agilis]GET13822.1 hypothetical protein SN4111_00840 [Ligilactobacillus agilis]